MTSGKIIKILLSRHCKCHFYSTCKLGDRQADHYINLTIQDINHLLRVADILEWMFKKVRAPADLCVFMQDRYDSCNSLGTSLQFNLKVRNHQVPPFFFFNYYWEFGAPQANRLQRLQKSIL